MEKSKGFVLKVEFQPNDSRRDGEEIEKSDRLIVKARQCRDRLTTAMFWRTRRQPVLKVFRLLSQSVRPRTY